MISHFSLPSQIFQFLYQVLNIYYFMLIVRIVLTWVVNSYTLEHHPLGRWLCALTDPFLRFFRRLPFAVIGGVIDISPIFALFAVTLLQRFVRSLSATQSASIPAVFLGMLFQLLISLIAIVKTVVLIAALILLFRLLHLLFSAKPPYNAVINHIDSAVRKLIDGPLGFVNLSRSKFVFQVTVLFVLASLITYLLALSEAALGGVFVRVLSSL